MIGLVHTIQHFDIQSGGHTHKKGYQWILLSLKVYLWLAHYVLKHPLIREDLNVITTSVPGGWWHIYYIRWFITVQLYAVMGSEAPLSRGQQLQPKQEHEVRRGHQNLAPNEASYGWPYPQAMLGAERNPYSTLSGIKSGSSSVKIKQGWVQMYSVSPTTPTEGGINRIYA